LRTSTALSPLPKTLRMPAMCKEDAMMLLTLSRRQP
jgi:hypothetical protein